MKNKLIVLTGLGLVVGCASSNHQCVSLIFPHLPSPEITAKLAATQPDTTTAEVAAWFNPGDRTFVLSSVHSNEIAAATGEGATATVIHSSGGLLTDGLCPGKR